MKIYQLHEYGGEWEDHYDYIIGSYLKKERAEEEKIKSETKENELREQGKQCSNCPFLDNPQALDALLSKYSDYCDKAELEESEYGVDCNNYFSKWDESSFAIEEVEVEE